MARVSKRYPALSILNSFITDGENLLHFPRVHFTLSGECEKLDLLSYRLQPCPCLMRILSWRHECERCRSSWHQCCWGASFSWGLLFSGAKQTKTRQRSCRLLLTLPWLSRY